MTEIVNAIHVCYHGWNRDCNRGCDLHCIRFDHVVFEGVVLIMNVLVASV